MNVSKFGRDLITERDGESYCPIRITGLTGSLSYIALSVADWWNGHNFDFQSWAQGFAMILAALGGGVGFNKPREEPPSRLRPDNPDR